MLLAGERGPQREFVQQRSEQPPGGVVVFVIGVLTEAGQRVVHLGHERQFHCLGHGLIEGMPQVFAAYPAAEKIRPEKFGKRRFDLGETAGIEASDRAEAARARGNHIHFCHWRQIERLLVILSIDQSIGTIH